MATSRVRATQRSYTIEYKLKIIKWYHENGENKHATARYFQVDRKRVREWLQKEDELNALRGDGKKKRHLGSRKPMSHELDEAVLEFLMEECAAGRPVSNKDLRSKALDLSRGFAVPSTFKASPMWLKRWKKRSKISLRCGTNDAQKVPEDYEGKLYDFRASVIQSHVKYNLGPSQVINMDQTMCHFDMVPSQTNDVTGKHSIRITSTKAKKKGFTVALAAKGCGEKLYQH